MTDIEDTRELTYWVRALSSRGEVKDKIHAVSSIKAIPDADKSEAFDLAMRDVFADTPPYDVSKIPADSRILDVLKDFAEESDQDYSTPYVHFIACFLQHIGLVNAPEPDRPKVAETDKTALLRKGSELEVKEQGGASGSSPSPRVPDIGTEKPSTNATPLQPAQVAAGDAEAGEAGAAATRLEAEVGCSTLSYTFAGSSNDPTRIGSGELMRLPKVLPAPPAGEDGETYAKWLDGEVWHPQAVSLRLTLFEGDLVDDIFEMQSEFYAVPAAARETYGSRTPYDLEASTANADGHSLYRRGCDIGFQAWTFEAAKDLLAETLMRYFYEFEPVTADYLGRIGFEVRIDIQLAAAVSSALDIEKYYIEKNAPDNSSAGGPQDLRGSISPNCRLDRPVILERSVINYFFTGTPIATSLLEGLRELRQAQLSRHLGVEVSNEDFDRKYDYDCFFDLDEYFPERSASAEMSPG